MEFFGPESRARAERKDDDSGNIVSLIKDAYLVSDRLFGSPRCELIVYIIYLVSDRLFW